MQGANPDCEGHQFLHDSDQKFTFSLQEESQTVKDSPAFGDRVTMDDPSYTHYYTEQGQNRPKFKGPSVSRFQGQALPMSTL
jgi:hypothetical protein